MTGKQTDTILTIDDEGAVRRVFARYLQKCGFHVIEADNGRTGLEVFERERPDLVLIDLRMPEVDGLQVLTTLARESPQTPAIIVSGTGVIADAVEALRLGAWDYVLKPIEDLAVLEHTVRKALERSRLRQDNQEYQRHLESTLKRLREDEEAGRRIQMKLLPSASCTIGSYTLDRHVMPSAYLSGDFVDYFPVNDDRLVFYSADVSGHGVSSSLVTVLLKSFMRKHLERYQRHNDEAILRPANLLQELNTELIDEDLGKHVTMFYGVLTESENTLSFASAGQFPYPLLCSDGGAEVLRERGTPVGLFPSVGYQTLSRQLPDDFLIAIFSDGILEVVARERLAEKLDFLKSLGTVTAIDEFVAQIDPDRMLPDDITVLTIRRGTSHV